MAAPIGVEKVSAPPSAESTQLKHDPGRQPWLRRLNPLKTRVIPPVPNGRQPSREPTAGFFSKLTFSWITPLMHVGYQRPLEPNDVWAVNPSRSVETIEPRFASEFQKAVDRGSNRPLLSALFGTFRREILMGGFCMLSQTVASALDPFVLRYLIEFSNEAYVAHRDGTPGPPIGRGIGLVFAITLLMVVVTFSVNQFLYLGMTVGGEARAVLMSAIFSKSLRISGRARAGGGHRFVPPPSSVKPGSDEEKSWYRKLLTSKTKGPSVAVDEGLEGWSNGRIVNLMSTDTNRIDQASGFFHMVWGAPLTVIITTVLLIINIGYSALPGVGLLVMGAPLFAKAMRSLLKRRATINKITDQRVTLTQEILQAIRFVKFFGWETSFLQRLQAVRKREVRAVTKLQGIRNAILAVAMAMPVFAAMLSFITYSLTNHALNPARIFSSLSLFQGLRLPLQMFPLIMAQTIDAHASIKRIQAFLLAEEIPDDGQYDLAAKHAIAMNHASFTWEQPAPSADAPPGPAALAVSKPKDTTKEELDKSRDGQASRSSNKRSSLSSPQPEAPFHMDNLDLTFGRTELVAIVGGVGSGKSSLLAALAGDMRLTEGKVTRGVESRAYCAQHAWIQNAPARENILFGRDMVRPWYDSVIAACALEPDFAMLPDGDQTEIGERGITLSGGQKARIAIARAIYSDAEIILLDDPLSAVDAHVGRKIMDEAICGLLAGKCRVLATHQLHTLYRCDRIVWLEGGRVKTQGSFRELMERDPEFREMMTLTSSVEADLQEEEDKKEEGELQQEIVEKKEEETGLTVGKPEEIVRILTTKSPKALMQTEDRAVKAVSWAVYAAYVRAAGGFFIVPLTLLLVVLSQGTNVVTNLWLSWWTSDKFHLAEGQWIGVYAGFGGIQVLSMFFFAFSITVGGTHASKVMQNRAMMRVLRSPMSFFDTTPLGRITNRFSKDVDVMDNSLTDSIRMYLTTLGSIVATMVLILVYYYYFVAALVPLVIIFVLAAQYYRSTAREIKRHEAVLRSHVFARFSEAIYGAATIRSYGRQARFEQTVRSAVDDFGGAYFLTFANQRWLSLRLDVVALIMVFVLGMLVVTSRFSVSPSIGGLVLSYMLSIMGMFQFTVRQMAEVENNMNNTERVHHYGTELEEEAPLHVDKPLPPGWPRQGDMEFDHVQMRYRPGLPLVLKDVTMHVRAGERLGIVGRTGAGKSSIVSTVFRLVELSGGSIRIDGVDISTIGLHTLRSNLAIIPQDPTLFKGTIRSNLDPFNESTDEVLWSALRDAHLVGGDATTPSLTLDTPIQEEGSNFSLGQRQLLALARALARRDARIVICDEATSSVDFATDQRVQHTLAQLGARGKTLMCIAHRLPTILAYDRVCVMDAGAVAELGPPLELFDAGGIFTGMCAKAGIGREEVVLAQTKQPEEQQLPQ